MSIPTFILKIQSKNWLNIYHFILGFTFSWQQYLKAFHYSMKPEISHNLGFIAFGVIKEGYSLLKF